MIKTLGTTTNFVVEYQDNFANAKERAQAVMQVCESEFAILRTWFQNTTGFGPTNRVTLQVETAQIASNGGYFTDGTTKVVMDPLDGLGISSLADDAVQGLYIAEIIEVLMSCRNFQTGKTTWHAGWSEGEGLSRLAAETFHPDGYYQVICPPLGGPFVNTWLQSAARMDWISQSEHTDKDVDSLGCGMLFLYYLRDQLGHGIADIVAKAGATLEETYHALTGKAGAYATFTKFLAAYFPVGQTRFLATEDPFPLEQGQKRSVQISFVEVPNGTPSVQSQGVAHVSPFVLCPAKDYHYEIDFTPSLLRCTATAQGFGQPVYTWRVNGVTVAGGTISPSMTYFVDNPDDPSQPTSIVAAVEIDASDAGDTSTYQGMSDELDVASVKSVGHEQLEIEVDVSEQFASHDVVTAAGWAMLDSQALNFEPQYYQDQAVCQGEFQKLLHGVKEELSYKWILIILTLPAPPLELYGSIQVLRQIIGDVQAVARKNPALAAQLGRVLGDVLHAPPSLFGVPASTGVTSGTVTGPAVTPDGTMGSVAVRH